MKTLVAIDGSAGALNALQRLLRWMDDGLRAEIVLVNVQEPASLYEVVRAHDPEVVKKVRAGAGADLLRSAEAMLEAAGIPYESEVAGGVPEHHIVEVAENYGCGLIVIGAHGEGESYERGLGSVAQSVVETSTIPVAVVRGDDGSATGGAAPEDDAPAAD